MLMFTFYVFMQELKAYIWYLAAVNSSGIKGRRKKIKNDTE